MPASATRLSKKELIREAAQRVFSKKGFYETTACQIAEEAGVAVGTLYNYFADKEDILIHIFEVEMNKRQHVINQIIANEENIRDQTKEIIAFQLERIRQNAELMRLFLCEEHHLGGKIGIYVHQMYKEIPNKVGLILTRAMGRKDIRPGDPLILAYAIIGAARAVVARAALYNDDDARRFQARAAEELADFIWNGIKPDTTSGHKEKR